MKNNIISIYVNSEWYKDDPFILATQAKQVFYLDDLLRVRDWKLVERVNHRQIWDLKDSSSEVNDAIDVVHETSSTKLVLTELGELILISDEPATDIDTDGEEDGESNIIKNDEVEDVDYELLVDFCEDGNCSRVDGNDSDNLVLHCIFL